MAAQGEHPTLPMDPTVFTKPGKGWGEDGMGNGEGGMTEPGAY